MKKAILLNILFWIGLNLLAQTKFQNATRALGPNPVYLIDSVRGVRSDLFKIVPKDIASIRIYHDKEATDILGEDGKDGIVYVETKLFARKRYWKYFKSKSKEYLDIVPTVESDSTIQYIINKHVLIPDSPGDLSAINDKTFESIQIVDKETLIKMYNVTNKQYGVIITSKSPESLDDTKGVFKKE